MRKAILVCMSAWCMTLWSQEIPQIDTDRPDQTETTGIVPRGYFQMENGFTFVKSDQDISQTLLPTSLWKIGLNDKTELRMITEPQLIRNDQSSTFGMPPVKFGFKSRLIDGKGLLPTISFIGHLSVPDLATSEFKGRNYTPDFRFTLSNELTPKLSVGYNLGMR